MSKSKSSPPPRPKNAFLFVLIMSALSLGVLGVGLVATEITLSSQGYGVGMETLKPIPNYPGFWMTNPDFSEKYQTLTAPGPTGGARAIIKLPKPANVIRGVVIGESTPQGFPYDSAFSFPEIAAVALNANQKEKTVEIVNLAFTAMSSYYVADAAQRVAEIEPDFVIIYSGHNEYYGTVSTSTGGSPLLKKFYLWLKNFRTGQLIFNLLTPAPQSSPDTTTMAIQFGAKTYPQDENADREVAKNYAANLGEAINTLHAKNIKVFLMEPVSNLVDMPPFKGVAANKIFNEAKLSQATGAQAASFYYQAKDGDEAPFRMRSAALLALNAVVAPQADVYISLTDALGRNKAGVYAFGNQIFADQLHFNWAGHKAVAKILAASLGNFYKLSTPDLEQWFRQDGEIKSSLHFMPVDELQAAQFIKSLVAHPPFSTMATPFDNPILHLDQIQPQPGVSQEQWASLLGTEATMIITRLNSFYLQNKAWEAALPFYKGLIKKFPGNSTVYLSYGNYWALQNIPEGDKKAIIQYRQGLSLGGSMAADLQKVLAFLEKYGREDLALQLKGIYGVK